MDLSVRVLTIVVVALLGIAGFVALDVMTGSDQSNDAASNADAAVDAAVPVVVEAELRDFEFSVRGVVGSQRIADDIDRGVERTFGARGVTDLTIDPGVGPVPWLERVPFAVAQLARLIDGTLTIAADRTVVTGRAPDEATRRLVVDALDPGAGFPPLDASGVEVVGSDPSVVTARAVGGRLTLAGSIPDDGTFGSIVVAGATDTYGAAAVVDELVRDPGSHAVFEQVAIVDAIAALAPAGDYELTIGPGSLVAALGSGLTLPTAQSEMTPDGKLALSSFGELIAKTEGPVVVEGHTDGVGSTASNQALSEARAEAVAVHLVALGVDPARLTVVGRGEAEPIAPNDTEEGRAANRRVIVAVGEGQPGRGP